MRNKGKIKTFLVASNNYDRTWVEKKCGIYCTHDYTPNVLCLLLKCQEQTEVNIGLSRC